VRPVPRLKKNAATELISTRVMKGVASPSRNQAIIHGGKEIEMSLIVGRPRGRARDSPNRAWSERANGKILGRPNLGDGERDRAGAKPATAGMP